MSQKESLHRLVDALPECAYAEAERYLIGLTTDDPVLRDFFLAPLDDEPETEEERLAVEEVRAELTGGEGILWETYSLPRKDAYRD